MNRIGQAPRTWMARVRPSGHDPRHWLLMICLLGAGANSLVCYFFYQPGYDHVADLVATGVFWLLALLVPGHRAYVLIGNLGLLTALTLTTYVVANTGGINSPGMLWITILAVPALLLLGRRWALFWMTAVVMVSLFLFVGVTQGWIDGYVNTDPSTVPWALKDKVMVILTLMLTVNFYEGLHQRQMREVERSNADLEATQKALMVAQSHKDEFIASIGHELRTPMNAILGLNSVLQTELAQQPENLAMARSIRESTEQLLRLVNDILDLSQLEAGRLSLLEKPLHLENTLRQILMPFEARAQKKSLQLRLELDPHLPTWVMADAQRLRQIMGNLLDNAIKFTHRGHVLVRVKPEDGFFHFEVEDTGRGIPPERQQLVFKRFEHADVQTRRAYGGTGVGLAVCESLVRLQGGRIGVHSAPGRGALFWFTLPLKACAAPSGNTTSPSVTVASTQPLRFLLVDDNAVNLMVAQLLLGKCWPGASVVSAHSGEQALQLLDAQTFDVVLMDMVMPGMDGLETTRHLRQHARSEVAHLPVIGLTANDNERDRARCLYAGMNEVLPKPMDGQAVMTVVQKLLTPATTGTDA